MLKGSCSISYLKKCGSRAGRIRTNAKIVSPICFSDNTFQKKCTILQAKNLLIDALWNTFFDRFDYLKNKFIVIPVLKYLFLHFCVFLSPLWRLFSLKTQGCNCLENLRYYKISICVQHVCDNLNECSSTQNL